MLLIYIIKANLILALLCLLFQTLMHRDTYFGIRRVMLLGIYATALLLPLWNLQGWMATQAETAEMAEAYASYVLPTLDVTAQRVAFLGVHQTEPGCGMWVVGFFILWGIIYLIPVAWFTAKLLWQLGYIIYLRFTCARETVLGQTVYRYPRSCSPFSFGPWIFLSSDEMGENELREVLIHERTHVREGHTMDILLAQLFCILFWWNPATWVLRREVRLNLEFIADAAVVGKDADRRTYQYHLLGFASQQHVATLANNFNVLPLKRRIMMMNATRTRRTGMLKYIFFVPAAAAMLLLSNVDAMARTLAGSAITGAVENNNAIQASAADDDDAIYEMAEVLPQYPGKEEALYRKIAETTRYPAAAMEAGVQGRVMVQFVVEKDGTLTDVKALDKVSSVTGRKAEVTVKAYKPEMTDEEKAGVDAYNAGIQALKDEAVRVVKKMDAKWTPGKNKGKDVRVRFLLPISFRLN
ncbi:MAG: M56 family metallopeptidase [Bacteroidaceae bacterium]|nr:M56 family metallopeptidase [Bacteroidaceae bacterium]